MAGEPLRYDQRPADRTPVHTTELPDTPTRDRNIVASAWVEAPSELRSLGDDLEGAPEAEYKRRIGRWLLWRAGPAVGDARYLVIATDDVAVQHTYRLRPEADGANGEGAGPSGEVHHRFRAWKEDLLGR
ncbi:MAG: hypothetical protein LH616_12105 [Ilumatobacteraceae bacterium]|nr:hypothetical protein [Ilumatobacteraceae bacterium]